MLFKRYKAEAEQLRLHQRGFDTNLGDVSAWSTLGWFEDPILSNMLQRSEASLARLIIHELTHGTLYVPGDADFSENLATFVGDNGAYAFLAWKFGKEAPQYRDYQGRMKDIKRYAAHVLAGAQRLDSLYNAMEPGWPIAVKDSLKFGMIAAIMADADTVSFYNAKRYRFVLSDDFRPNNTFFMRYKMYREQQNQLELEFREQFNGDFERYLQHLKAHYGNASGS
ncbi:MAG: aminopeptidase [Bacteroidota bacterium]